MGHEAMEPGGEAYDAVVAAFGTVDRRRLAELVFADRAQLERLNAIVHPAVRSRATRSVSGDWRTHSAWEWLFMWRRF